MEILVNVIGQKLRIGTNCKTLVDGTSRFIKFTFILPDEWAGLDTKAQFIQDGNAYDGELDGHGGTYLPDQIHDGKCEVILHGVGGGVTANTDSLMLTIKGSSYRKDGKDTTFMVATIEEMREYLNI